jgi:hypothetical protein
VAENAADGAAHRDVVRMALASPEGRALLAELSQVMAAPTQLPPPSPDAAADPSF